MARLDMSWQNTVVDFCCVHGQGYLVFVVSCPWYADDAWYSTTNNN